MGEAYQIRDQEMPYLLDFQLGGWPEFARKGKSDNLEIMHSPVMKKLEKKLMIKSKIHMKIPKYLIFSFLNFVMIISCNEKKETVFSSILEDISSNSYYIPIDVKNENTIYEIVIPNDKLYNILSEEFGKEFNLETHIKIIGQIMQNGRHLKVSNNNFDKFIPYILPTDWNQQVNEASNLFQNNIQNAKIENELILIRQLFESEYFVYKDDETGLLVRKEIRL